MMGRSYFFSTFKFQFCQFSGGFRRLCVAVTLCFFFLASVLFTGCADQGGPIKKQQVGTLLGAGTGALLGAQFGQGSGQLAAVAAGTLAGALIGGSLGESLDRADQMYLSQSTQSALEYQPSGKSSSWHNPDSGHSGTVTPTRTFENQGSYCREFTQHVVVDGKQQKAYGTACRQPDGSWKIVQ